MEYRGAAEPPRAGKSTPTRPASRRPTPRDDPRREPGELAWNCANRAWRETAGPCEPEIIPMKTNCKSFDTLFLPSFFPSFFFSLTVLALSLCALPHSQLSLPLPLSLALPGTRPLTCQGGKSFKEREKKKSLNHGRDSAVLLVWQVPLGF